MILKDHSPEVLRAESAAIARAMQIIGLKMEKYAKDELTRQGAVDTGRLRASVSHVAEDKSAVVGTNVEYAPYIEYGTSRMRPRQYIRPAAQSHGSEYKGIIHAELKGA